MVEYVMSLDVIGIVLDTLRDTRTFLEDHLLVVALVAVGAFLLYHWTTARPR